MRLDRAGLRHVGGGIERPYAVAPPRSRRPSRRCRRYCRSRSARPRRRPRRSARAMPSPMPLVEPVTIATRPASGFELRAEEGAAGRVSSISIGRSPRIGRQPSGHHGGMSKRAEMPDCSGFDADALSRATRARTRGFVTLARENSPIQEIRDKGRRELAMRLEHEVAGLDEVQLGIRKIAAIRLCSGHREERVVTTPQDQRRGVGTCGRTRGSAGRARHSFYSRRTGRAERRCCGVGSSASNPASRCRG